LLSILLEYECECPKSDLNEVDLLIKNPYLAKNSYLLSELEYYFKKYQRQRRVFKS
jgi:hypothetical protein